LGTAQKFLFLWELSRMAAHPESLFRRRLDARKRCFPLCRWSVEKVCPQAITGGNLPFPARVLSTGPRKNIMSSNTTRIAKNTLMLYFRQILIMLVSLYTVRVVLETLGAEDYGIYNVVAGVVAMFGFLSGSMASVTQRYLSVELGKGNFEQLKIVFNVSFTIHLLISLIVLILAESAGLWFIAKGLAIPPERRSAALWAYQFSIISFVFTILTAPYIATILAHEDMNIYAHVSVLEAVIKLGMAFFLEFFVWDALKLYSILLCLVSFIITAIYRIICIHKYNECKLKLYWNKNLFREMMSFMGFTCVGSFTGIIRNQAIAILLNQFFTPIVVSARGIALQVSNAVGGFSSNIYNAFRPHIMRTYAAGNRNDSFRMVFLSAKAMYGMMNILVLPLMLEASFVLALWLKSPPSYTVLFTRLILLDTLAGMLSAPTGSISQASGRIKEIQLFSNGILLLNLPCSWIVLTLGAPAYIVMIISIGLTLFAQFLQVFIVKRLVDFPAAAFFKEVVLKMLLVTVLSSIVPVIIWFFMSMGFLRLCLVTAVSIASIGICLYFIAFTKTEQRSIQTLFVNFVRGNIK
jgi:O-antigen/teichoic acid export membrane protein